MPLSQGKRLGPDVRLGPYVILDLIGVGGMGEVYRARDTRLDRTVAIKVLAASTTDERKARARFEREAKAISRLSHPHICAIYDVGREDGVDYIVMEHLQGETLSRRLERGLRLDNALQFAVQIAGALAEAHRAGIVHRDLKPGNVMLTPSGAKLLDFGLAKRQEPEVEGLSATPDTVTEGGQLVGTLPYMSPEQVEGQEADARSDIFSFGAMLHEMITHRRAFYGSRVHLIAAILSSDPPPPSSLQVLCPPELDHLVARCLAKDPAERWQSAQDLLLELRWAIARTPGLDRPRRAWLRSLGWAAAAGAGLAALWLAVLLQRADNDPLPSPSPQRITIAPGLETAPVLSPDGGSIAYASDEAGSKDVWIVDVRGGNAIRLTDQDAYDTDPAWFPDGSALAFTSDRGGSASIWKVLRFGGAPTLLVPNAEDASVAPDGRQLAFARIGATGKARIWIAPLSDPSQARMLTGDDDGFWDHRDPAFSPDGATICYRGLRDLWLVPAQGGPARRLTTDDQTDVEPAWSADGRHIYFSSFRGGAWGIWRVPSTGGPPRRVTPGTGGERHPSLSLDGKRLALASLNEQLDIMLLDLDGRKELRLPGHLLGSPAWAPDGRSLIYTSSRIGGRFDLWIQPIRGLQPSGPPRRLTDHPGSASSPAFSPDGRWVAYYRVFEGQRDIWVMPSAGGNPIQFTSDAAADIHPAWSPDGRRIAYSSERSGRPGILVEPVAEGRSTGPATALTTGTTADQLPAWSPDGAWIAYIGTATDGTIDVWIVDSEGARPPRMLATEGRAGRACWEPDGRSLLVSGLWDSKVSLRKYSVETGHRIPLDPPVPLGQNLDLFDFNISRDGHSIVFRRDESRGDIWVLESQDRPY